MGQALTVAVIGPGSPAWRRVLAECRHDFYHLPDYVALEAGRLGGEALAVVAERGDARLFLPLVARPLTVVGEPLPGRPDAMDALSPYGYPAPLVRAPSDGRFTGAFVRDALDAVRAALSERRIVSAFMRLHPVLDGPDPALLAEQGTLVQHGRTVWVDLGLPVEELERQTRKTYRNLVRRLDGRGLSARMVPWDEGLDHFVGLYTETMRLVGADTSYDFGRDYFDGLGRALGSRLSVCLVEDGAEVACAGLFTECGGIVQYHLSGSNPASPHQDATKLMLHHTRGWARERGAVVFHLGGGVGAGDDSLFFFKSGFSKLTAPFHTWRVVLDGDAFRAAVLRWEDSAGLPAGPTDGFFPPYRRPIAAGGATG